MIKFRVGAGRSDLQPSVARENRNCWRWGVSALVLVMPFSAGWAAETSAATDSDQQHFEDIVVTARRTAESLQDVPVAVTALNGEALRSASIEKFEDLQRAVPGLLATPSARGDTAPLYLIRGQRGALLPSLIVDPAVGLYFNEFSLTRSVGTNQSMFDLQSVQVLKGPQGTLFGRNSTGGAVLITPNAPSFDFDGYLQATAGNYSFRDVEGVVNVPLVTDKVAIRYGGKFSKRDGYLKNVLTGQDVNDLDAEAHRLSLLFKLAEGVESTFVGTHYRSDANGFAQKLNYIEPSRISVAPAAPFLIAEMAATRAVGKYEFRNPREFYSFDKVQSIQNNTQVALGQHGALGDLTLKNIVGYRKVNNRYLQDFFGGGLAVYSLDGNVTSSNWSEEIQLQGNTGSVDYTLGAYYFSEKGTDAATAVQFAFLGPIVPASFPVYINYDYDIDNSSLAFFGHVNAQLSGVAEGLALSAGLRWTRDRRSIEWHNLSPTTPARTAWLCSNTSIVYPTNERSQCNSKGKSQTNEITYDVSLNYKLNEDMMVYLAHRRGYRSGGFNQTPQPGVPLTFDPELVKDVEFGMKSDFNLSGMPVRLNMASYYQWYSNVQRGFSVRLLNPVTNVAFTTSITDNAAKAYIYGGETEFSIRPVTGLDLTASYALTVAGYSKWIDNYAVGGVLTPIDLSDSKFSSVPKHQLNVSATYALPIAAHMGDLSVRLSYYYQSRFETTDINTKNCGTDGLYRHCLNHKAALPSYDLVNARIDWRDIAGKGFDVALFVNNLTNKYYLPFSTNAVGTIGTAAVAVGAPRMWGVQVRVPFGH